MLCSCREPHTHHKSQPSKQQLLLPMTQILPTAHGKVHQARTTRAASNHNNTKSKNHNKPHSSVKSTLLAPRRRRNQNGGQEIGCEASYAQLWKTRPCTGVGGGGEHHTHGSRVEITRMEEACCWLGDSEGHDMDGKFPMVRKRVKEREAIGYLQVDAMKMKFRCLGIRKRG
jgi:hypothetical protein